MLRRFGPSFISFLISYLIVLSIPALIGGVVLLRSIGDLENQAEREHAERYERIGRIIESRFEEMRIFSDHFAVNGRFLKAMTDPPQRGEFQYALSEILRDFRSIKNLVPHVDDFFIYVSTLNVVVTPSSVIAPELYYEYFYNSERNDFSEWKRKTLNTRHSGKIQPYTMIQASSAPARYLVSMNTIVNPENYRPIGVSGVLLSESSIRSCIESELFPSE